MEKSDPLKVVGSNAGTGYHMEHLSHCKKVLLFLKKKNKWKRGRGWPIFKNSDYKQIKLSVNSMG